MADNFESFLRLKLLSSIEGIGLKTISILLSEFTSINELIEASPGRLMSIPELSKSAVQKIHNFNFNDKKLIDYYADLYNRSTDSGINILTYYCNDYPTELKNIFAPPSILYSFGDISLLSVNSVSVVGTRNNSVYGKIQTEQLTKGLVQNQICIISGMAKGIDTIAHKTALENNGKTIAIIGSGLDVIYPADNKKLFNEIKNEGLIISEFDIGTKPDAGNFPRRNRIISALSLGTLVIETRKKGGALQTAQLALEQGKEVFAVPGNVSSPNSEGTNLLIQNGSAKLVTDTDDILIELKIKNSPCIKENKTTDVTLTLFEEKVFSQITSEPIHLDIISRESEISIQDCSSLLLLLEMKNLIVQLPGKNFIRR